MKLEGAFFAWVLLAACGGQRTSPQVAGAADGWRDAGGTESSSRGATDAGSDIRERPMEVVTAKAHAEGKHYELDVRAPGTVSVGGSGELEVVLLATDGYHINDEFPYKLKTAAEPAGVVSFEKIELARGDGSYTKTEGRFRARFAGARAGEAKIGGTMALSVCTKKECIVDKIALEVPVTIR